MISPEIFVLSDAVGFFFSGAITLLLFGILIVYLKTQEKIYLYYTLFLLFILIYGITNLKEIKNVDLFFLNYFRNNKRFIEPMTILSFSFYIFFAIKLVNIDINRPQLANKLSIFGILSIVYSVLYFVFFNYIEPYQVTIFIIARIFIFTLCGYFLFQIYKHIYSPVKMFFIVGSIFYFLGSVLASIRFAQVEIPFEFFYAIRASSYFQIGILLQAVFFTLGMGEKVLFQQQEIDQKQRTIIQELALEDIYIKETNRRLEEEIKSRVDEVIAIRENLEEQERRRVTAEYEYDLLKSEIKAKQAQINPHFIFNSLNAIKYLILQNESQKATKYLVNFSRFIREVLEQVNSEIVPLASEISIIKKYLDLEKKRFDESFNFTIVNHLSDDLNYFETPPFLLQPFVENAIWHGLLPSNKDEKNLFVVLDKTPNGIKIIIEDNGVGRQVKKSGISQKKTEGIGISLTLRRIELFNLNHKTQKISCRIIDLKDKNGEALGTKIELILIGLAKETN